jgi:phosphinothricin acetyltransferase
VTVYLDPEERGKGYGTALMKELEFLAKEQGIRKLVSLVTDGNEASEHLHASLGYEKMTVLKDTGYKFGTWIGVAYYMKDIGGAD